MIVPFIPKSSCSAHLYGYTPGLVNVIRKRVVPTGVSGSPIWPSGEETMKPECTLSEVELMVACSAPSASGLTFDDGGIGLPGSSPKVMVWGMLGSSFVHSTVAPA